MGKIYIRTYAYNAGATLRRAVDSVLNQTHGDFIYYLCENGSTDDGKTRRIVEEYASRDRRIKAFYNKVNRAYRETPECLFLPYNIEANDFFCILDSDDEYLPTFFEEMLAFINEYDLDIAACGSDFLSVADNDRLAGQRLLSQNLILQGNGFGDNFTRYHQFMRTTWGKLYKGWTFRNTEQEPVAPRFPRAYGGDTYNAMRAFRDAKRVGILAKSLHKYYVSAKSVSYVMHPERVESDQILHEATLDYLKPYGLLSPLNERFIYLVYFSAIKDTMKVVCNSQLSLIEKLQHTKRLFACEYTQELLHHKFVYIHSVANEWCGTILDWILAQNECRSGEGSEIAAEIIADMHRDLLEIVPLDGLRYIITEMPEMVKQLVRRDYESILLRLRKWFKRHDADIPSLTGLEIVASVALVKPDDEIFALLAEIKKNRPQSSAALDIDARIGRLIEKYPTLKSVGANLAGVFQSAVCWVMKYDFEQALKAFLSTENVEIDDRDAEEYILFGQNLSAAAENTDAYMYFKKMWISFLIGSSRTEQAANELTELEQLSPDDEDFIALRKSL